FDSAGTIHCATVDAAAEAAINASCSLYVGWSDGCNGCATPPQKWGQVSSSSCQNGFGQDNTCSTFTLGSAEITMFGLNPDGDVDDNDKFFPSLHCEPGSTATTSGPCSAGTFATTVTGTDITCTDAAGAVSDYVRQNCVLYTGITDKCDGCLLPPAKWGY